MEPLINKRCIPCEGNVPPLSREEAEKLLAQVPEWRLSEDGKRISRKFPFPSFEKTMQFVNAVAGVAEKEGHHPDLSVSYGSVGVELSTHAIGGLSENDFILAAKIDALGR